MKAARMHHFGGPEVVVIDEVPIPQPSDDQVLIRVLAAGVNPIDVSTHTGAIRKYHYTIEFPYTFGWEVSGIVTTVGTHVHDFCPGDEVVALPGQRGGGYADYVVVPPDVVAHKPTAVDHTHMAGVPVAGLAAWQALFEHGQLQRGQRVLVLAASGGVGSFAVQFARWAGAKVWGTTSTKHLDLVRSLGATPIDYTVGPFEQAVDDIDLVVDPLGGDAQVRAWSMLKPTGALISTTAPAIDPEGTRRGALVIVQRSTRKAAQLGKIGTLLANGTVHMVLDEVVPLLEVHQALAKSASGHAGGKIILDLSQ